MRTVNEVSQKTGVSIRTLHYYDQIGLLKPTQVTASGYRLYDDEALERLQSILLFRELQFSLQEIGQILDSPGFDRGKALEQQMTLLRLQKEHIENLIDLARSIQKTGVRTLDFSAFDTQKMDEYAAKAKASWGQTEPYREYEKKSAGRTKAQQDELNRELMAIFAEFGALREQPAQSPAAKALVEKLRGFLQDHYYACTPMMLQSLGEMYAGGGAMTENIDAAGGPGTGAFVQAAILAYCEQA